MHPQFRDVAFYGLPVPEAARFSLPQACRDTSLRALVLQIIEPGNELFRLKNGEHASTVATWIRVVKGGCCVRGPALEFSG